jgi:hypothetical protein
MSASCGTAVVYTNMGREAKVKKARLIIRIPCARCGVLVVVEGYQCFMAKPICADCLKRV